MMADPAPLPTIVLASGSGTNLQALIDASREQDFPGEILAVGCNRPVPSRWSGQPSCQNLSCGPPSMVPAKSLMAP